MDYDNHGSKAEMHNIMYIYKENPEWVNMHNGPRNTMINTKEDPLKFF